MNDSSQFISEDTHSSHVWKDDIAFSAVISACEKGGKWEMALNLLQKMPEAEDASSCSIWQLFNKFNTLFHVTSEYFR